MGLARDRAARRARCAGRSLVDEAYADFADGNALAAGPRRQGDRDADVLEVVRPGRGALRLRRHDAARWPAQLVKVKDSYNCDVLSLAAATAAIEDQDYMLAMRQRVLATRARLAAALARLGFAVTPSQANFVWARRSDRPVKPIFEELKRRNILVRYMAYEGYGDGLRISVGSDAEIDRFLEEVAAI